MLRVRRGGFTALLLGLVVTTVAGCDGSAGTSKDAAGAGGPSRPSLSPCPTPKDTSVTLPPGPSSRLPYPGFAADPESLPTSGRGNQLIRFNTAMALRDAVSFVTEQLPSAGYAIGEGDAEQHEADVPFSKGPVTGKLRLSEVSACSTTWLIATHTH